MRRPAAILGSIAALVSGVAMNPSFAQAQPQAMHPGDAGYEVVLAAATRPLRESLDGRVQLEVERMDRIGDWAFVLGTMRAPGGGRPDLSGTRFAEASVQGGMSDLYVVLLKREPEAPNAGRDDDAGGTWTVLDHAIGPGDVAWLEWPAEHAAPRALFGF